MAWTWRRSTTSGTPSPPHFDSVEQLHVCWADLKGKIYKATWKRLFKLPWREAGPPNHLDDEVDWDHWIVNKELPLCWADRGQWRGHGVGLQLLTLLSRAMFAEQVAGDRADMASVYRERERVLC